VKQRFNIYTIMLLISLLAIITACFLLGNELGDYGGFFDNFLGWWKVS
jgi:hypothetical protein